jgi:hypothetical protein
MKMPDRPQAPEETVGLGTGDCDDFAALAVAILVKNGINSDVVIIKYRGLNVLHAVCMYRETDGTYSFISNMELHRTHQRDVAGAITKFYPDWDKIMVANKRTENVPISMLTQEISVL